MKVMLKDTTMAFPAIFEPEAIGDGSPAYGAKFVVDPKNKALVKELDDAIETVAKAKWKDDYKDVLAVLEEEKRLAFSKSPYKNKKTGKVYDGFEGMYSISTRSEDTRPTAVARDGKTHLTKADGKIYSGVKVHASLEFWAQDNTYGRRVNCTLRGVMYAGEGTRFGGTSPASLDEFSDFASDEVEDFV